MRAGDSPSLCCGVFDEIRHGVWCLGNQRDARLLLLLFSCVLGGGLVVHFLELQPPPGPVGVEIFVGAQWSWLVMPNS